MKRKYVYAALALPFIVFLVFLAVMPARTRSTFITEFQHRTAALFGQAPAATPRPSGLRLDHPDEYGPQPGAEADDTDDEQSEPSSTTE